MIFSNRCSISLTFLLSAPHDANVGTLEVVAQALYPVLILGGLFLLFAVLIGCFLLSYFLNWLLDLLHPLLLIPCNVFFISVNVLFISEWSFFCFLSVFYVSCHFAEVLPKFIDRPSNQCSELCASDRLFVPFCLVLFLESFLFFYLGHFLCLLILAASQYLFICIW